MLDKRILALGAPDAAMADMGGEFEREVKEELGAMGSKNMSSTPMQPDAERHLREARPDVEGSRKGAGLGVLHIFR